MIKKEKGFTLLEVLAVIIIIGILGTIVIPKLTSSTKNARQKADVATAHQVKAALDRYELENGAYPTDLREVVLSEEEGPEGSVVSESLIPKYISKLDASTTQQTAPEGGAGFGVHEITPDAGDTFSIPTTAEPTNTIMIYLFGNGLGAEVRVYDESLDKVLWTSAN